jgi:P4 family phage/plasmid primase-like protien
MKPLGASQEEWHWFAQRLKLAADLLPAVPDRDVTVSQNSRLDAGRLGKVPSRYNPDGTVSGIADWTVLPVTPHMVRLWSHGALYSVCVRGHGACAIDADVETVSGAQGVLAVLQKHGVNLPIRRREGSNRLLLPFRLEAGRTLARDVITVADGKIELLGTRQHWVACGRHPSGARYWWENGLPQDIPLLTWEALGALWAALGGGALGNVRDRLAVVDPSVGAGAGIDDPITQHLIARGFARQAVDGGRLAVRCPWASGHTMDGGVLESVWQLPGAGYVEGHYKCLHASCAKRTDDEFLRAVDYQEGVEAIFGLKPTDPVPEPPASETPAADGHVVAVPLGGGGDATLPEFVREDHTDSGNVNVLARLAGGNLKYAWEMEIWLAWWGDQRWLRDEPGEHARSQALRVAEFYMTEGVRLSGVAERLPVGSDARGDAEIDAERAFKWAAGCRNRVRLTAMLGEAQADGRFLIAARCLDLDPWLMGVPNGVVDLRTGVLTQAAKEALVTHQAGVLFDPEARAPRWERFIQEVTGLPAGRQEYRARPQLAAYLQRMLGLLCTGITTDQKVFIAHGGGSNGKNILFDTVCAALGSYAQVIPSGVLMESGESGDAEKPLPHVRKLQGARLALASETKAGQKLDSGVVKSLTGDRLITARGLHENPISFERLFKPVLMTNHRPTLETLDPAMRGRVHMIPFDRQWNRPGEPMPDPNLPDGDPELEAELRAEMPGILAWLVRGAVLYRAQGLGLCAEVEASTLSYLAEQDPVGKFLSLCTACEARDGMSASELLPCLRAWADESDLPVDHITEELLGKALRRRGVAQHRSKDKRRFALRPPNFVEL